MNANFQYAIVRFGSSQHRQDVAELTAAGVPLPYGYAAVDSRSLSIGAHWVRVLDERQAILSGFVIQTSKNRALPGTLIGSVDRLGRRLHEPLLPNLGEMLVEAALAIPRLTRLNARVLDEDGERKDRILTSIERAGGTLSAHCAWYTRTIVADLKGTVGFDLPSITETARYNIKKFSRTPKFEVRRISDIRYAGRMWELFASTFKRTGCTAPGIDMRCRIEDATHSMRSRLVGVHIRDRQPPMDLVAFMRAELHGDHACYEEGAIERSEELRGQPLGYRLMVDLLDWTRSAGGTWFDFGGIPAHESSSRIPLAGITQFKRQFSRTELDIAREAILTPRPALDRVARATRSAVRIVRR